MIEGMRSIGEFFQKIRNKQVQESYLRISICEAVKAAAGVDIVVGDISFSATTLVLKGLSQSAKSVVYMKKGTILADIAGRSPARNILDIRTL